jgi:SAM-dependent methyltransferase
MSSAYVDEGSGLASLVCPKCRGTLSPVDRQLTCSSCQASGTVAADNAVDFIGGLTPLVEQMARWSDEQTRTIESASAGLFEKKPVSADEAGVLRQAELLNADGKLNELGRMVGYDSAELVWQSRYDPLESLFDASTLAQDATVLDIGGGSGQTLRRLFPGRRGAVLDIVPVHIAFGSRIWRLHKLPIIGICGSAEHLPCADASVDFVICRGVIMYTDHQTAVNEVFRVLKKGCHAFFRVESFWWDLNVMRQTRNPVTIAFGLRSLLVGKVLGATGVQPRLGRGWVFGPRAYVTPSRFRKMVHAAGGDVLRYESSTRGPQVGGHGTQDVVLCVKR